MIHIDTISCVLSPCVSPLSNLVIITDLPQVSVEYDRADGLADIAEGDQVAVSCSAIGNPVPDIMWYRDISGEIVSRHNTLTISDIRRDQAGAYVCQANNSVGQSNPRKIDIQVKCEYPWLCSY